MSGLSEELVKKILQMVKKSRNCKRVEIGKRYLFHRHCGMRMIQVKVFYSKGEKECPTHKGKGRNEYRGYDERVCVCPDCLYHEIAGGAGPY